MFSIPDPDSCWGIKLLSQCSYKQIYSDTDHTSDTRQYGVGLTDLNDSMTINTIDESSQSH